MIFINYIFLDFEMNEVEDFKINKYCPNEIIQIGAIKLNHNLKEIDHFNAYIKPQYNYIIPRISNMTGITNEKVENSDDFSKVLDRFVDWVGEDFQIFAWSSNDYRQLRDEAKYKNYNNENLKKIFKNWSDFQKEFCNLLGLGKNNRISLDLALNLVGASFKGKRHNALSDSRNTIYLYKISRNKEQFKKDMQNIKNVLFQKKEKTTIGDILGSQLDVIKKDLK